MRKGLLTIPAAAMLITGCGTGHASDSKADNGPAARRTFAVGTFNRVEVGGPYTVNVTTGGQPGATALGPKDALDKMVVEVRDGTLQIGPKKRGSNWNWSGAGSNTGKVTVEVSGPMIDGAGVGGSGSITVNRIAGASFKGEVGGSGGLRLPSVEVGQLSLAVAGSGSVEAKGLARTAAYKIAGSGDIRASGVQSATAATSIAGSGSIAAHVRDTVSGSIAGSGNIDVTGGAKCSVSRAGSGNINC